MTCIDSKVILRVTFVCRRRYAFGRLFRANAFSIFHPVAVTCIQRSALALRKLINDFLLLALTLFIHSGMKNDEIISTLKNKTELAKRYGLNHFYVHSKGIRNIRAIKKCLADFEKTYQAIPKVERHIEALNIIVIQFILK